MENFRFIKGELYCEDVPLKEIVKFTGTPVYIYSASSIRASIRRLKHSLPTDALICYSLKANSNLSILRIVREEGCGADVVSGGELFRALRAGISPEKIVFSGVGKTEQEIEFAVKSDLFLINVESFDELYLVNEIAGRLGKKANISIRVNPDVSANTHDYIKTGTKYNKFGIPEENAIEAYMKASKLKNLNIIGIHCHIGSQILSLDEYTHAFEKIKSLLLRIKGEGIKIEVIDFGGGMGIRYREEDIQFDISAYGRLIHEIVISTGTRAVVEPGRYVVGEAGILVGRILYLKKNLHKNFIITDIGMNDLIRPSLYNAYHQVKTVDEREGELEEFDVVGPVCESGDFIRKNVKLPPVSKGELIAVFSAGAYGFSMSSNYNSRPRPAEVLVEGDSFRIVRRREKYEDMISLEEL
uniref:diaminopimelate decarboxylase n=1 Tax=uncultured prokaryote TaxID=198431 RepID=H5SPZ4_9ZZZZ|nr:diaminopimelate decarboxylase [uncultured prokaryote]